MSWVILPRRDAAIPAAVSATTGARVAWLDPVWRNTRDCDWVRRTGTVVMVSPDNPWGRDIIGDDDRCYTVAACRLESLPTRLPEIGDLVDVEVANPNWCPDWMPDAGRTTVVRGEVIDIVTVNGAELYEVLIPGLRRCLFAASELDVVQPAEVA